MFLPVFVSTICELKKNNCSVLVFNICFLMKHFMINLLKYNFKENIKTLK